MVCYIGIDPGKRGGVAFIHSSPSCLTTVVKMPETDKDLYDLLNATSEFEEDKMNIAILEKVHSMPGQGVVSVFTFGKGFGALRMGLTACKIPFSEVTPQKWQRALAIPKRRKEETKTAFKTRLKERAQQEFPNLKVTKVTCDALLIALYNYKINNNLL